MSQPLEIPPRFLPRRRWGRAFRALRQLLRAESDAVDRARDIVLALGDRSGERSFQRFAHSAEGRRLIEMRPALVEVLGDRDALERLDRDSFGRAYLRYLDENGFEPGYLVAVRRRSDERWEREEGMTPLDPLRAWFHDRTILSHDLFHVLTGYGTDGVGEAALLPFTLGQTPGVPGGFLTLGAGLGVIAQRRVPPRHALAWLVYLYRAWRRGRRADWLPCAPWEELLPLPLAIVRERLHVAASEDTHPGGILRDAQLAAATGS